MTSEQQEALDLAKAFVADELAHIRAAFSNPDDDAVAALHARAYSHLHVTPSNIQSLGEGRATRPGQTSALIPGLVEEAARRAERTIFMVTEHERAGERVFCVYTSGTRGSKMYSDVLHTRASAASSRSSDAAL